MHVWGWKDIRRKEPPTIYQTFELKMRVKEIKVLDDNLFFLFPSGEIRLYRYSSKKVDPATHWFGMDEEGLVAKPIGEAQEKTAAER